jgi:O-6-methylguanine DNA methyltransferase
MNETPRENSVELRPLIEGLRGLGDAAAPATLRPRVLSRLALGDAYVQLDTPLGPLFVAYNRLGVSAVVRAADAADFERRFRARFGRPTYAATVLPAWLSRAFNPPAGTRRAPPPRVDLRGLSEFEQAVLRKALEIPRGEVRPYAWVAREIGQPGAVRAVGTALGRNPVPLLIPCHRVVRSDGRIGGYALGTEAKRALLAAEGLDPDTIERLAQARYHGSDTTRVYCHPTCRAARRIGEAHRVSFRSAREAADAGYRPCKLCRPA